MEDKITEGKIIEGRAPRVVIVGGGFGGLTAARALRGAAVRVILIDRTNHHLFQPLLYQVATAGLSPADIASPIRSILRRQKNAEVVMADVTGVDTVNRRVLMGEHSIGYDCLIIATGARDSYFGHDDWRHFARGLKSIPDATAARREILLAFEAAEREGELMQVASVEELAGYVARRKAMLTFVLVGAGPTGVEMAGAIAELAHKALTTDFRHIDPNAARILLIEAGPRILAAFPEELASAAHSRLLTMGVEIRTGARVAAIDAGGVTVGGERIEANTVIWTAGVRASPAGEWLGAESDKGGRIRVEADLSLPGHPEVFAIGDTATREQNGKPLPGVAPVAIQQGEYVASVISARIRNDRAPEPFSYFDKGNLATVGRSFAILNIRKFSLSGFPAWVAWLGVHIMYLIGFRNRLLVLIQWAWAYVTFQRGARLIPGGLSDSDNNSDLAGANASNAATKPE